MTVQPLTEAGPAPYIVLDSIRHQDQDELREQFALDVLMGLSAEDKFLPSKYFYDARGSRLFEAITDLAEYYPTRCEFDILRRHGGAMARHFAGAPFEVVELGAGDGRKTKVLLSELLKTNDQVSYIPVDISESAVAELVASLQHSHPGLRTQGIVGEYFDSMRYLEAHSDRRKLVLFLGSNIGNFDTAAAMRFLRTLWKRMNGGDMLLVGFDMKKDIQVVLKAYNDPAGVTRQFNLNVLRRINEELGADFDLDGFTHHGLYNPRLGAMESHLISLREQEICVGELEKKFRFAPFEALHMEYSYKYLIDDIDAMARATGFQIMDHWWDSRGYFVDSLWQVSKDS